MCSTALHTILHTLDYDTQHVDCHLRYNSSLFIKTVMESIRLLVGRSSSKVSYFFFSGMEADRNVKVVGGDVAVL